jgi:uncharacterized protein YukE
MSQLGMNADVVEQLGHQLKQQAADIAGIVTHINGLVGNMEQNWWGPDAQTFCNNWWPQHRTELTNVQHNVDGLGQSALNNATEQRNVSSH